MRKRTKLRKKVHTNPSISSKIMSIEQSICESHSKEKLYDETLAVTRIKSDPNWIFLKPLTRSTMVLFCISLETLGSLAIWVYGSISSYLDSICPIAWWS